MAPQRAPKKNLGAWGPWGPMGPCGALEAPCGPTLCCGTARSAMYACHHRVLQHRRQLLTATNFSPPPKGPGPQGPHLTPQRGPNRAPRAPHGPMGPQGPHAPQGAFLGPLGPQGPLQGHRGTQGEPPEPPGGSGDIFGKTRILASRWPPGTGQNISPQTLL